MSRIGKKLIEIPDKIKINIVDKVIKIEGPKGKMEHKINENFDYVLEDKSLKIVPKVKVMDKKIKSLYGLERAILQNKIKGVVNEYTKSLILQGTGYKVQLQGNKLNFSIGLSHPIIYEIPAGIKVVSEEINKNFKIIVSGIDKQLVGRVAAEIRDIKRAEPYQGKGILYEGERIRRKVGKSVAATGAGASGAK